MSKDKTLKARFSASKRDFLKKMALLGIYIGPAMKTFDMAVVGSKPTGPPKKKKDNGGGEDEDPKPEEPPKKGTASLPGFSDKDRLA